MRVLRVFLAVAMITTLAGAPGSAQTQADRDAQRAEFRAAIALEKEAADLMPLDFDGAKTKLDEAATKLEGLQAKGDVAQLADDAAALDRAAIEHIDEITSDGDVTQEEMEGLNWLLRMALADKNEALLLISFIDGIAKMVQKKHTPLTRVQPPNCQSPGQEVSAQSSCYTVDVWKINIAKNARAAVCKFVDGSGDRVTNLAPLFDDVIQNTTCRLTDQTVVVNGVEKRVVRATLKLTTLSSFNPTGSANVKVTAFWR